MLSRRQEQILLLLKKFDYLTVKQFQNLIDLKSNRNAYRVIKQLEAYMNVFRDEGINVYHLNKKGREYVNCNKKRTKLTTAKHYLMRNDLFIHLGFPSSWRNEIRMRYENSKDPITIVADAHYTSVAYPHAKHHLIEVDHTQKMQKNKIKIEKYRRLIEKGAFKGMPELVWVTSTPYRQKTLKELCDGLDAKVYLSTDLNEGG